MPSRAQCARARTLVSLSILGLCLYAQRVGTPSAAALPQLADITASTKIHFNHLASPDKKYIVESMSGGVALIDYDRDGWPDIYFTNSPDVDMQLAGKKARSALFHNNHDGTFTDVSQASGIGRQTGKGMGVAFADVDGERHRSRIGDEGWWTGWRSLSGCCD